MQVMLDVWMEGGGGGEGGREKGISQAFDFCTIFWLKFPTLGREK